MKNGLREQVTAVCGLVFVWTVSRANHFGHLIMFGMPDKSDEILYYGIWLAAVSLVALSIANDKTLSTLVDYGKKRWFPVALGLSLGAGCLLLTVCVEGVVLFPWFIIIGGLLNGLGMLGLFPLWAYYLMHKRSKTIYVLMLASMAVSCVITILLNLIQRFDYEWIMPLLAIMPGICYALLPREVKWEELSEGEASRDIALIPGKPLSTILALFFFMLVGTLVKGQSLVEGGFTFSESLTLTVMIAILGYVIVAVMVIRIWQERQHIGFFCVALICIYLVCLVLHLVWPELPVVDGIVMATRYGLNFFFVLLLILFARTEKIKPKTGVALFAAGQLLGAALAYCIVPLLIISTGIDQSAVSWAAFVLMVVGSAVVCWLLIKSRIEMETAAADMETAATNKVVTGEQLREMAIDRISKEHGLTPREKEILQLLAQGFTEAGMAEKLVLSKSTVSSHRRSLYKKLGCSQDERRHKNEAIAFIEDEVQKLKDEG